MLEPSALLHALAGGVVRHDVVDSQPPLREKHLPALGAFLVEE